MIIKLLNAMWYPASDPAPLQKKIKRILVGKVVKCE